jgi:hypothetical protein
LHLDAHGYKRNTGRGESDSGSLIPWWPRIAHLSVKSHPGIAPGPSLTTRERESGRANEREGESERARERERERARANKRERERANERERERTRERESELERERERERESERTREREQTRERERARADEGEREGTRERERVMDREHEMMSMVQTVLYIKKRIIIIMHAAMCTSRCTHTLQDAHTH